MTNCVSSLVTPKKAPNSAVSERKVTNSVQTYYSWRALFPV